MGRGEELTEDERQVIIYSLSKGQTAVQIGKLLKRDTRTVKKAIKNIDYARKPRQDKGKCMVPQESIEMIKNVAQKHPGLSSQEIFEIAGVGGCGKSLRCAILKKIGHVRTNYISRGPPVTVENISTESLETIKAIFKANPHLSSKDVFELAGVPDVSRNLRDQILKEFSVTVTNVVNNSSANPSTTKDADATNPARDTGTSVPDETEENLVIDTDAIPNKANDVNITNTTRNTATTFKDRAEENIDFDTGARSNKANDANIIRNAARDTWTTFPYRTEENTVHDTGARSNAANDADETNTAWQWHTSTAVPDRTGENIVYDTGTRPNKAIDVNVSNVSRDIGTTFPHRTGENIVYDSGATSNLANYANITNSARYTGSAFQYRTEEMARMRNIDYTGRFGLPNVTRPDITLENRTSNHIFIKEEFLDTRREEMDLIYQ